MNDQELTYLEQIKATKAFNTQLAEVSTQILKINEEFEAFNDNFKCCYKNMARFSFYI